MKRNNKMKASGKITAALLASLLTACGGGGDTGNSDNTSNRTPTANAGGDVSVDARSSVKLSGSGTDSDGSIATYAWTQTGGTSATLSGDDTQDLEFTAPNTDSVETLTFELTVTDNGGAIAKDSVEVTVAPVISLSGKIYDGPIADAVITVTVGERTYTATADAAGVYTVDIGTVDPDAFITIQAAGADGQEHVELLSLAGSFGALQAAAGEDGILDGAESGNVDVTNLSTAKAVLMIEANGGNDITDDSTLATAESNISGDDLLYLATVIKLVVDGGYDLPEGVDSTLKLVEDRTTTDSFVAAVDADDADAFGTSYDAIVSDPNLMPAFETAKLPATLFTLYVASTTDPSPTYRVINRGKRWTFGADGRGTRADANEASAPFDWTITDGKLVVTYDTPLDSAGWCTHPDQPENNSYWCESKTTGNTLTLVTDGATADTILVASSGQTLYPDDPGLRQPIAMTGSATNIGLLPSGAIPFAASEMTGRWIATATGLDPTGMANGLLDSGFVSFSENGTGERMATEHAAAETFAWSIANGVLKVDYAGGDSVEYFRLRKDGDVFDTLAVVTTVAGGKYSEAGLMLAVNEEQLLQLLQEDVAGRYSLYEMPNEFNIRINANGTGVNERYAPEMIDAEPFSWALDADEVSMNYYFDIDLDTHASSCSNLAACHNWMDRNWFPVAYVEETGRVYLLEVQQYYDYDATSYAGKGAVNYYQPTVRYFGRSELSNDAVISKISARESSASANRMQRILGSPQMSTN